MKKMKNILFLVGLCILFSDCQNDAKSKKPFANCPCGTPLPMFNETLPEHIATRNFSLSNDAGIENVKMKNGTILQVVQTGCKDIKQEFTFVYTDPKYKTYTDAQWIQNAVDEFLKIASFSPTFVSFQQWGSAMEHFKSNFKIAEKTELEKGFFITIDKIVSESESSLIVTIYADSCQ
jgi:hypothetical protein